MADHSSDLFEVTCKSGSDARASIAQSRASIEAAREAMAEADNVLSGGKVLGPVAPVGAPEPDR